MTLSRTAHMILLCLTLALLAALARPGLAQTIGAPTEAAVAVPVLAERLAPGTVIEPHHIAMAELRPTQVTAAIVTDPDALIGMAAKRSLVAGRPVRISQIQEPLLVEKSDSVTLVLRNGGLSLSARGRALEDGAEGRAIRVMNAASKRVVEGTVIGPGLVRVSLGPPLY